MKSSEITTGAILLAHGSNDGRWKKPFQQLTKKVQDQKSNVIVELAYMEFTEPTITMAMNKIVEQSTRVKRVYLIPLFLAAGGHLLHDVPRLVKQLTQAYPDIQFIQSGPIGEEAIVQAAIQQAIHNFLGENI